MLLEVQVFDFLPTCHDTCSATETNSLPHRVEVLVVNNANVVGLRGECGELIAGEIVVMISHRVCEAAYDGFCDICFC